MGRIRTIKPELFRHEKLFEAEQEFKLPLRLTYAGLFTCCDREGRFRWRPRQLKLDILPYDDIDFARVLDALASCGFVVKYQVSGELYGCIPSWKKHQHINNKEMPSDMPVPDENNICDSHKLRVIHASATRDQSTPEKLRNSEGEEEMEGNMQQEEKGKDISVESRCAFMPSTDLPIITIPLHDKTEFPIFQNQVEEWRELYPAVDILQSLRNIRGWNLSNPKKRKTKSGILRHIVTWLAKEQDKGGHYERRINSSNLFTENSSAGADWLAQSQPSIIDGELINEA